MAHLERILENETVTLVRVLEQIRREGPISQVEIGQKLGIGRAVVNVHVKKLVADHIVVPTGNREGATGRPRVLLDMNREGKGVLGISLDAPRLSGAVMDFSNRIVFKRELDLSEETAADGVAKRVLELVRILVAEAGKRSLELFSACFSVPGVMTPGTGKIINYVNMPAANGLDVKQVLRTLLDVPIYVVPLAAASYWGGLEPDQAETPIFQVTWDLGVGLMFGRGFEIGFKHYKKRDVTAVTGGIRDVGHTVLHPGGRRCYCGRRGCLEAYLGGRAITDRWNARSGKPPIGFTQLMHLARSGDPGVAALLTRHARRLGDTLGWIFAVHQPGCVKLSGQVPDAAPYAREAFWQGVRRRIGDDLPVAFDYLGDVRSLTLNGSCRLALHVRFNQPLLEIVSDDEAREPGKPAAVAV